MTARGTSFEALFGVPADVRAHAPGRVNLMGDHTDYSGGFVLPAAIPQTTRVELSARSDRRVRVWSAAYPEADPATYELGGERRNGTWLDYVQGMTAVLSDHGLERGFDARRVLTVDFTLLPPRYDTDRSIAFLRTLVERARSLPGV